MEACPQHTFQILTKRSERLREIGKLLPWPPNVWMGVSVEDARVIDRITDLAAVPMGRLTRHPVSAGLTNRKA